MTKYQKLLAGYGDAHLYFHQLEGLPKAPGLSWLYQNQVKASLDFISQTTDQVGQWW